MRYLFFAFLLVLMAVIFLPNKIFASDQKWFYPMTQIFDRATVKGFGMYIDNNFYATHKASEFPNHFLGFHAAQDLESLSSEKADSVNVPVYFVTSGTISYIGGLSGYGGVVLVKLDGTNDTALYGHVRISGIKFSVGEHVSVGKPTVLTYLGNGFSPETSGERKHLHFGIYRGQDLYFHGHEGSKQVLNSRWYNPLDYLKSKNAISLDQQISPSPSPIMLNTKEQNQGLITSIISKILTLFRGLKF